MSKQYTVKSGDTLSKIAGEQYGQTEKWTTIYKANQTTLKSGDPNLIFPGEVIIIPELSERVKLKNEQIAKSLENADKNSYKLIINDLKIPVQAFTITRTMDTAADGWTASIAWTPGLDTNLDEATKMKKYHDASFYLGGVLQINGSLYGVKQKKDNSSITKELVGWSFTADAIDSTIKPPYEVSKYTLKQRATDLIDPLGIGIQWDIDDDLKFDKITASPEDTIFKHLLKYAKQKGVLISSTPVGDLQFLRANVDGESVGTIEESQQGFLNYEISFDGRKLFNSYKAIGQSPKSGSKFEIAKDDSVPKSRMLTFKSPDSSEGDLKGSAEWRRSSQLATTLTQSFIATSWYAPNNELWQENTIVTVKSPSLSLDTGFDFLIKRVTFKLDNNGRTADLSLVPPQVYSGEIIPDIFK